MEQKRTHTNRLVNEKSPYLLQHAHNPVEWFAWGDDAFVRARQEDKPIFLSIGYSTCHWCHVMAGESFEDPEVARLLNDVFVCIKVDREERPDIDNIYTTICQLMTGTAGWPLTIIMTPDKRPFFATTYMPKTTRFGRIGLWELVSRVKSLWHNQRAQLLNTADQIAAFLAQVSQDVEGQEIDATILKKTYTELVNNFDETHGGFGTAPKFATAHNLFFLLRYWKRYDDNNALAMVEKTLQSLRLGGIYDHVGFGFHRYSTDEQWLVPHFEKMLYDQALLGLAYVEVYQATKKAAYETTAREVFTYVLRDMASPLGGFYSAEDADSEGKEGLFYLWIYKEIHEILGKEARFIHKIV